MIAHFRRDPSRSWPRHVIAPLIGMVITGFVLWNTDLHAKLAGAAWLAAGAIFYLALRLLGRPTEVADG